MSSALIVAIHQPNYLPWLGYFYKIAKADIFIFLDDVQYSKNTVINRVKVLTPGGPKWLTVPVSVSLGTPINKTLPRDQKWPMEHLDKLRQYYRKANAFGDVWPQIERLYENLPTTDLAAINRHFIEGIVANLKLDCRLEASSSFDVADTLSDDRLIQLISEFGTPAQYLSGKGGANYQDSEKFEAAEITLTYTEFQHPEYQQVSPDFEPGLSILDAVFSLGWEKTAALLSA